MVTLTRPLTRRFTTEQVAAAVGIPYRRVDYWLRQRLALHHDPKPGSGQPRSFTLDEARAVAVVAELTRAGVRLQTAAHIAVSGPEFESGHVQIQVDIPAVYAELEENFDAQS